MPEYRFYEIDKLGRISGPPAVADCQDDAAALAEPVPVADGCSLEIWLGTRKVAFRPGDLPNESRS